ncbi:regulatory iron-sulfur-containing complex subunit RicT [Chitinispirillales bacterium ANBcel5]|uniref:PSP1 domain-containing protein n=1 Tax=Cellulosispirillum alkaliphilum TaxID=3039283 RepID=UPI002A582332|nr:regulatory iron-sulfur-containing complex subunit RicT [Chitinispirillales bacterium ANBcel5]
MAKNSKLVEIAFKGERKAIYRDRNEIDISEGDYVLVEAERGQDLGKVSLIGSLVKLKRNKGEIRNIIKKASPGDIEILFKNKEKEKSAFKVCREKIKKYYLEMKLVDVEIQFDGSKITFYFTAAQRVDFRELVKDLASVYRTRIELRQIGVRDEAKRISGCGICGRKQCCSAFLTEFEQITTQMAKDQQLALNPSKISGNCGRLLCCLRYENESYLEMFAEFPPIGSRITLDGKQGLLNYINIFQSKALIHFSDGTQSWLGPEEIKKGTFEYATSQ